MIKIYEKYLLFNRQIMTVKLANKIKNLINDIYPEYKTEIRTNKGVIWIDIKRALQLPGFDANSTTTSSVFSLENCYKEIDFTIYSTMREKFPELFEFFKKVFEIDNIPAGAYPAGRSHHYLKKLETEKIPEYIEKLTKDNYELFINTTKYNL